MASFCVRTLGFPEVRCEGRPTTFALRKGLALLVYLAEAKGPVGRDTLATMLWPESPAEVVKARLRRLLHNLQLALGDVLTPDRSTVRLSPAINLEIDSRLFEEACDRGEFVRACGLYQADFLDGDDHWPFAGDRQAVLDHIRLFVGELAANSVSSAYAARRKR